MKNLKVGDLIRGIPHDQKGNTEIHNFEVTEIYTIEGKRKYRCFSLTGTISYPGVPDWGREIVFNEVDLVNLERIE